MILHFTSVGDPDVRVLDRYLDCLALNCVGGAALLGGVLAGFKLDAHTPGEHGEILLRNLLRAGCGFVGSGGGRVIALVNQRRAVRICL